MSALGTPILSVRRRVVRLRVALIGLVVAAVAGVLPAPALAQVDEPSFGAAALGGSSQTAARSCWEIKQTTPAAADGSYWLVTPTLVAPRRFYCDMTTDGGGWVLVGRGRDRWNLSYGGQGTPDQVRTTIDGTGAFAPAALSAKVVDGLLNGGRPDQLAEGVRLRRATTVDGTRRQEVRIDLADRDRWVWTFEAEHPIDTFRIDGAAGTGGTTRNFGFDTGLRRVRPGLTGWGFGPDVAAGDGASSYLTTSPWGEVTLPFTQVFLRPRLTAANTPFPVVPDGGLPASAQRKLLANDAEPNPWGVTGTANGRSSELDTQVQAFAQSGNRMIVGGNFEFVQKGAGATGADRVRQPFLAAFDVRTGAWLPDFRPELNGQVKDLHTLPNGNVVAAGEFTTVNGRARVGLVALDPARGTTVETFAVDVENRLDSTVSVQALDRQGPWLYLGGRFTHVVGGGRAVYARSAARVAVTNGLPDNTWAPEFNGTVVDLDASAQGDRVHLAGYFTQYKSQPIVPVTSLSTAAGAALVPGLAAPRFSTDPARYQQTILEVGSRVWYGGAEHMLFSADRATFRSLSGNITIFGGDFQALASAHGVVYGGCHCVDFNYSGIYNYLLGRPGRPAEPGFTQADNIIYTGAWDAATGDYLPDFVPDLGTTMAHGTWELAVDTLGRMWMGGDFSAARTTTGRREWAGGFVRFGERDSVAPSVPESLSGSHRSGSTTLQWGPSTDDRAVVGYEVLRHDRVVATTSARQLTLPSPGGSARWFVRAVDAAGNRSATTSVLVTTPFTDTASSVHARMIDAMASARITLGCNPAGTLYCPVAGVSREQMASFLVRAYGLDPAEEDHFDDDATSAHQDAINRLADAGITSGSGERRFSPGAIVTREQMATFLTAAEGLEPRATGPFTDVAGVHAPNVNAVAHAGITLGCNPGRTLYCPGAPVQRDQMASFLGRALGL